MQTLSEQQRNLLNTIRKAILLKKPEQFPDNINGAVLFVEGTEDDEGFPRIFLQWTLLSEDPVIYDYRIIGGATSNLMIGVTAGQFKATKDTLSGLFKIQRDQITTRLADKGKAFVEDNMREFKSIPQIGAIQVLESAGKGNFLEAYKLWTQYVTIQGYSRYLQEMAKYEIRRGLGINQIVSFKEMREGFEIYVDLSIGKLLKKDVNNPDYNFSRNMFNNYVAEFYLGNHGSFAETWMSPYKLELDEFKTISEFADARAKNEFPVVPVNEPAETTAKRTALLAALKAKFAKYEPVWDWGRYSEAKFFTGYEYILSSGSPANVVLFAWFLHAWIVHSKATSARNDTDDGKRYIYNNLVRICKNAWGGGMKGDSTKVSLSIALDLMTHPKEFDKNAAAAISGIIQKGLKKTLGLAENFNFRVVPQE